MVIQLRGLAEGIVGSASVEANSTEELFVTYPELKTSAHKLTVTEDTVTGYAACDG